MDRRRFSRKPRQSSGERWKWRQSVSPGKECGMEKWGGESVLGSPDLKLWAKEKTCRQERAGAPRDTGRMV
jgi:hypothetical protein